MVRVIGLFVAASLLLAGCGSADPKEPKPTAAVSATATVPAMPPEAKEDSKAGAIAFVKHYIDVFNYASNTGDVEELQKLSDPKCEACRNYIQLFDKTYSEGGYFKDSDWILSDPRLEVRDQASVVLGHIHAPAGTYKVRKGIDVKPGDPEDFAATYLPFHATDGWQMSNFGKQGSESK